MKILTTDKQTKYVARDLAFSLKLPKVSTGLLTLTGRQKVKKMSSLLFHKQQQDTILNSNRNFNHKLSIQEAILDLITIQLLSPKLTSKYKTALSVQSCLFNLNQLKCPSISMTRLRNVATMLRKFSLNSH